MKFQSLVVALIACFAGVAAAQEVTTLSPSTPVVSDALRLRLEQRGVDVDKLQQRMIDNGRDGSGFRDRLEARGIDPQQLRTRVESGERPMAAGNRPVATPEQREAVRDRISERRINEGLPVRTSGQVMRTQQGISPAERREAISNSLDRTGIDRSQLRDELRAGQNMSPDQRAARIEAFRSRIQSRR